MMLLPRGNMMGCSDWMEKWSKIASCTTMHSAMRAIHQMVKDGIASPSEMGDLVIAWNKRWMTTDKLVDI
jgi:hypothetical protein